MSSFEQKFDPSDPKYKKVEDLPEEERGKFCDVKGGGFVREEAFLHDYYNNNLRGDGLINEAKHLDGLEERKLWQSSYREQREGIASVTLEEIKNKYGIDVPKPTQDEISYLEKAGMKASGSEIIEDAVARLVKCALQGKLLIDGPEVDLVISEIVGLANAKSKEEVDEIGSSLLQHLILLEVQEIPDSIFGKNFGRNGYVGNVPIGVTSYGQDGVIREIHKNKETLKNLREKDADTIKELIFKNLTDAFFHGSGVSKANFAKEKILRMISPFMLATSCNPFGSRPDFQGIAFPEEVVRINPYFGETFFQNLIRNRIQKQAIEMGVIKFSKGNNEYQGEGQVHDIVSGKDFYIRSGGGHKIEVVYDGEVQSNS